MYFLLSYFHYHASTHTHTHHTLSHTNTHTYIYTHMHTLKHSLTHTHTTDYHAPCTCDLSLNCDRYRRPSDPSSLSPCRLVALCPVSVLVIPGGDCSWRKSCGATTIPVHPHLPAAVNDPDSCSRIPPESGPAVLQPSDRRVHRSGVLLHGEHLHGCCLGEGRWSSPWPQREGKSWL